MCKPTNVRGHFSSLWEKDGDMLVPTSITSRRKSRAKEKEAARKADIIADIEKLTGSEYAAIVAKSYDGTARRWKNVNDGKRDD